MSKGINDKISLAAAFVNNTASHIFLTGKAGTGKTTFLQNLAKATHKNFAVVAPTGIAALNAKGVTIHSQFLLPFGTYLPSPVNWSENPKGNFYTRQELAQRHPLNSVRKQVLRNIDILIIDEVSMLRADVLDAIDYRLKSVKQNFRKSFGGVQLLLIGDLYQLPPIIKDYEWTYLKEFYKSPHFFEAQALKESHLTYIELDKIFRQQDDVFIDVLNNLRNNECSQEDINLLNNYYKPSYNAKDAITITTHNYQADEINRNALDKIESKTHYFEAEISGDFPESAYPLQESLEIKEGAQVMLVKNDNEYNRYFNGKLARITSINMGEIKVETDTEEFTLERYTWENRKYSIHPIHKSIEEEVVGTFKQYPIKLAWAITVHKSQGLTFDKAIIDVKQAFAPGQVYVALSRLRSLDGLILRSKIAKSVISNDNQVVAFGEAQKRDLNLEHALVLEEKRYLLEMLWQTFDFTEVVSQIKYVQEKAGAKMEFEDEEMRLALSFLYKGFEKEKIVLEKFRRQIHQLITDDNHKLLLERIQKGVMYYQAYITDLQLNLLIHIKEVSELKRIKTYKNALDEIDQLICIKLEQLYKCSHIALCIIEGKEIGKISGKKIQEDRTLLLKKAADYVEQNPKQLKNKSGKKKAKPKGATYKETYALVSEGLSLKAIAEKRNLTLGTIESHIVKGIGAGELEIISVMKVQAIGVIEKAIEGNLNSNVTAVYQKLNEEYTYGEIRMVLAHLRKLKA